MSFGRNAQPIKLGVLRDWANPDDCFLPLQMEFAAGHEQGVIDCPVELVVPFALPQGSLADEPIFWTDLLAKDGHSEVGMLIDQSLNNALPTGAPVSDAVLTETRDNVLVMTINRPEAHNAINRAVAVGLAAALDRLDAEPALSVGVLTGSGGTFSSGMDLKGFLTGDVPVIEGRGLGGLTQAPPRKPLIAAVEGWALAGGFEMVLSCDLVVASREAKFGIPEVKRSLVAGAGGLLRLPKRMPYHIAMELALTGDPLTAVDAHRYGLVNRLAEPGGAFDAALALAAQVAANGPLALAATKEIMRRSLDWTEDEGWKAQSDIMMPVFASQDAREGATAFAEKRPPRWQGK